MARIHIEIPEHPVVSYSTELAVRISDINIGGHLGHDALISLLHEARARCFASHGWNELEVEPPATGIIMADLAVQYLGEAFFGDRLRIDISARDWSSKGCDLVYRMLCVIPAAGAEGGPGPREIARAKTGIVFFDYGERKAVPIPAAFRSVFGDSA